MKKKSLTHLLYPPIYNFCKLTYMLYENNIINAYCFSGAAKEQIVCLPYYSLVAMNS